MLFTFDELAERKIFPTPSKIPPKFTLTPTLSRQGRGSILTFYEAEKFN